MRTTTRKVPRATARPIWDPTGTTESSIAVQNLDVRRLLQRHGCPARRASARRRRHLRLHFHGRKPRVVLRSGDASDSSQSQSMVDGRWYATATTLGDGRIMAFSGLELSGAHEQTPWRSTTSDNAGAGWSSPTSRALQPAALPAHGAAAKRQGVLHGTRERRVRTRNGWMFDPCDAGPGRSSAPTTRNRIYGSAVILPLLPPSYTPRVMAFGGGRNPATSYDGDHRPLRRLADLDAGSQHVDAAASR